MLVNEIIFIQKKHLEEFKIPIINNSLNINISMINNFVIINTTAGETAKFMCATEMKWTGITATWMKDNKPLGDAMGK